MTLESHHRAVHEHDDANGMRLIPASAQTMQVKKRKLAYGVLWNAMIVSCVLTYGSYTILMHLCEVDHHMPFSASSMVFLIESLKLVISLSAYAYETADKPKSFNWPSAKFVLPFTIPAVLYCLNNNLSIYMQLQMDSASYQVLSNLKVLTTAFIYRLALGRRLRWLQWFAIFLLAVGSGFNSYGGLMANRANVATVSHDVLHVSVTGLLMIAVYSTVSAVAGVYTEYVLKDNYDCSIYLQNSPELSFLHSILYIFGILANGIVWVFDVLRSDPSSDSGSWNLFHGYTSYAWAVVVSQALVGLMISAVMKHASNITRLFIIACAMLVATVLSVAVFHLRLNAYFLAAFALVLFALYLYHKS